jgi:hypothetical protein
LVHDGLEVTVAVVPAGVPAASVRLTGLRSLAVAIRRRTGSRIPVHCFRAMSVTDPPARRRSLELAFTAPEAGVLLVALPGLSGPVVSLDSVVRLATSPSMARYQLQPLRMRVARMGRDVPVQITATINPDHTTHLAVTLWTRHGALYASANLVGSNPTRETLAVLEGKVGLYP